MDASMDDRGDERRTSSERYTGSKFSRHHDERRENSRERIRNRRSRSPDSRRRDRSRDRKRDDGRENDRRSERDRNGGRDRDWEHKRRRSRDKDDNRRSRHHSERDSNKNRERDGMNDKDAVVRRSGPLPSQSDSFALTTGEEIPKPKEKANFGNSGTLAAASNAITQADGSQIVLKYHEPPEARKPAPKDVWKLFVFKGDEIIDTVPLSHRSCWLVGREAAVVDMIAEHPSISKQHAVIQFRYLEKRNEFGDKIGKVKPYLIDLDSANGTLLNSKKVPESRYLELMDKDLVQFGQSTREYVIMLAPKD